jgi:hypothetical protein
MKRWTRGTLLLAATAALTGAGVGACLSDARPEHSFVPIDSGNGTSAMDGHATTDGPSAMDSQTAEDTGMTAADTGGGDAASTADAPEEAVAPTEGGVSAEASGADAFTSE